MFTTAVFILFLLCIAIQLGFVLYFFVHIFSLSQKKADYTPSKPVSVIICAHNEAANLRRNLPAVLAQRYTNAAGNTLFEVIVVNDASTDDTEELLQDLQNLHSNLQIVTILPGAPRKYPGKKHALNEALAIAQHDILVMTDADCMPASSFWLYQMAQPFHEGKEIVTGYGQYKTEQSVLNSFIRWETAHAFMQFSSYARAGRPYMAVGRNLACTRTAFLKAQASPQWDKLPSGDDDLLMQAAGGKHNVYVVSHPAAFTITDAKANWGEYARQKQRHLSTGKYYRWLVKMLLANYGFSHALAWLSFFILLFTPHWGEALGIMAFRSVIYWTVWQRTACILSERRLIRFFPLFDFGWLVYNFAFLPYILWKNKQQWT